MMRIPSPTATAGSGAFSKIPIQTTGSLYFHIPFCAKKCPYCHFFVIPDTKEFQEIYREAILLECARQLPLFQEKEIVSLYFGGGTPSLYSLPYLEELLHVIRSSVQIAKDCEITIEANPEDVSLEKFHAFREMGINRLSIGIQSLDDSSLQTLERMHTATRAKQAIFQASEAGFDNISIDLMTELPSQTESGWKKTLDEVKLLPISHVSLYNLTFEPHTSFYKRKEALQKLVPPSDECVRYLEMGVDALEKMGLSRYEISAFGKPSVHNTGYWQGRPFLGLGPSAFSYFEGKRFQNICRLHRYRELLREGKSPIDFEEKLEYPANFNERLAIHLRLKIGIDIEQLASELEVEAPQETKSALQKLVQDGFLIQNKTHYLLSDNGRLFYDSVAAAVI